jgi:hypothetical protein
MHSEQCSLRLRNNLGTPQVARQGPPTFCGRVFLGRAVESPFFPRLPRCRRSALAFHSCPLLTPKSLLRNALTGVVP